VEKKQMISRLKIAIYFRTALARFEMKKGIISIFLQRLAGIILMVLTYAAAHAQHPFRSVESLWEYADTHNVSLILAETNIKTASVNTVQAHRNRLPAVSLNGGFTDNVLIQPTLIPSSLFNPGAPEGTFTEATFGRQYIYNASLNMQWNLINTGDWFSVKAARYNEEIARLSLKESKKEIYEQIANAYYSHFLADQILALGIENKASTDSILSIANQKWEEGQVSEIAVNSAKINAVRSEKSLQAAMLNSRLALNTIRQLLGLGYADSLDLSHEIPADPLAASGDFAADPEHDIAFAQLNLARSNYQAAKASYWPVLSVVYQGNTQVAGDQLFNFKNANTLPQRYYGLRLNIPLAAGGSRNAQVARSRLDLASKTTLYESVTKQNALEDQNLMLDYQTSRDQYHKSKEILELYRSNDFHAGQKLREGVISLDERLRSYNDYVANQNEFFQSMSDFLIQQYRMQIRSKIL
jgi:outer membrane protein TolC